jgi:hypothetical protein
MLAEGSVEGLPWWQQRYMWMWWAQFMHQLFRIFPHTCSLDCVANKAL